MIFIRRLFLLLLPLVAGISYEVLKLLAHKENKCTVLGPAPCAVPKINYNFRYRVTLRGLMDRPKRLLLAHLLREFSKDKANRNVNAYIDVNGYD